MKDAPAARAKSHDLLVSRNDSYDHRDNVDIPKSWMPAPSEKDSIGRLLSGVSPDWLGNSVWQASEIEISKVKSWPFITAMTYRRGGGESIWRGDRHRMTVFLDQLPPVLVQVEQGPIGELPPAAPGTLSFCPPDVTLRSVTPPARFIQVAWDTDLCSMLLPELRVNAPCFEPLLYFRDSLLGQIATTLAQEVEGGFADKILVESLGTALCIRLARQFLGDLPLPTSKGLSPERLRRVRDYVEAHLDDDLSLTVLAGIAALSPFHFSRSFKQATGVGPQRYVIQRRLERAKRLLRRTRQPLAWIAQEAGFADQSHLTQIFRRELGVTPGRYRAALV
jgi:AraC family transcriptional regulator